MEMVYIAMLFAAAVFETVTAKTCYTTDLQSLRGGNLDALNASPQDCKTYLINTMKSQGVYNPKIPDYIDYSCYTLAVDIDQPVGGINIVGCIPSGGCAVMKNAFMSTIKHHGGIAAQKIHGAHCSECDTSYCNVVKVRESRSIVKKRYSQDAIKKAADITLAATNMLI